MRKDCVLITKLVYLLGSTHAFYMHEQSISTLYYKDKATSASGYKPLVVIISCTRRKVRISIFSYLHIIYLIAADESTLTAGNTSDVSQSSISKQGMLLA